MAIPYYQELEKNKQCINLGYVKEDDSQLEESKLLLSPIVGSYFSNSGILVNCTGGHKGNNFIYSVYYHGIRDLLCSEGYSESFLNYNNLEIHKKQLKNLKKYLFELKRGDLSSIDTLLSKYYNWAYEFNFLNLKEMIPNLIGLIDADIDIYELFLELKLCIDDLISLTGFEEKEVFGVVVGKKPIIGITNEYLNEDLKDKNDFFVQLVGFDKVESQLKRTITTSRLNINERFFNYLIMNWQVYQIPKFVIDKNSRKLKIVSSTNYSLANNSGLERELSKEIQLIKKYIPLSERPQYFI